MDCMETKEVPAGMCISTFMKLRVVGISPSKMLKVGDTILIKPKDSNGKRVIISQTIASMEIDHMPVKAVKPGTACGIKLCCSRTQMPQHGDQLFLVKYHTDVPAGSNQLGDTPSFQTNVEDPLDSPVARQQANYD